MKASTRFVLLMIMLVALAGFACSGGEKASQPEMAAGATPSMAPSTGNPTSQVVIPEPPEGSGGGNTALLWTAPKSWTAQEPTSSMRKAQYSIPGPAGAAQLVVYYFGPGQGGDPMSNAQRWAHQFKQPDGSNAFDAMKVTDLEATEVPVKLVEITGTYAGGMGSGPSSAMENYMLLGGIAEGPDAPWFFKLTGPEATVRAQRDAFISMLAQARPAR